LDTLTEGGEFNPSDYAYNLTRRVRGLPLWFSLATHGTRAYSDAVAQNIDVAHSIAEVIRERDDLELVREPELSIVVFKKLGWQLADYDRWSAKLLESGLGFVVPSSHRGEPNTRFAIVNPRTTVELLVSILDTMKDD
jgi:glutamate/tyrosine decarboxylase-like PLP-dependent enzyme